ncbi:DEAD/DEAH box helicase [Microlunatus soli]|uniref:Superfamily II DNA or RNA helicase, SNF2 family n=1 Tax=Microlunatus soli TaxID=630515 RepID=A0A1H1YD05_9ACTN|nr:SNF2-related protein [Microlunatus soli]SDT19261.1 Superfamily II DNA or RNA helicase, SNF2 family [Microlunatus soli]
MIDLSDDAIGNLVGWNTLYRGVEYAASGRVERVNWSQGQSVLDGVVSGSRPQPYRVNILFNGGRTSRPTVGVCSCPMHINCKHVAATLIGARQPSEDDAGSTSWRRMLEPLVRHNTAPVTAVALQLDLRSSSPEPLRARPVVKGKSGRWIRGDVGWQLFGTSSPAGDFDPGHHQLLAAIRGLGRDQWSHQQNWKRLDDVSSSALWALLGDVRRSGLTLIGDDSGAPVLIDDEPVRVWLEAHRDDDGLTLAPVFEQQGETFDPTKTTVVGVPQQLLARRDDDGGLRFAMLEQPLDPAISRLLISGQSLVVPGEDEQKFLDDYFPRLRTTIAVRSSDHSFVPPARREPVLALELRPRSDHQMELRWDWWYRRGEDDPGERFSLVVGAGSQNRDLPAEQEILTRLDLKRFDVLLDSSVSRSLLARNKLGTEDMIHFVSEVLPQLDGQAGLMIIFEGQLPEYSEASRPPMIKVKTEHIRGERDWFELSVTVEVDGERVEFATLFKALAKGEPMLVLPSGTYFRLNRPEFRQLADLIAEARAIGEPTADGVTVSRFQVDWWEEIEKLGVDLEQAAEWRSAISGLRSAGEVERIEPPAGFTATLRDYQRDGLDWLAYLHDHGLGGVLADDMGLGKTLQTLALICHARERGTGGSEPYLVVAPTSVVGNWAAEASRFAPDLKVVAITETEGKSGVALPDAVAGADLVLTSYTLLRIDFDNYAALRWAGMMLDEAQFVKNHQSRAYQCVRMIDAPFKVAITGTPMENNLMELWSMFSITAPGLFPGPTAFRDDYAKPIERNHDQTLLDRLRSRVRPFMLRRTKEQVAAELPPRQEQVIALDLLPKHRKVYQTHLHRERQKILGLLDDLDANRFEVFRSLTLLRQLSLDASLHDDQYADVPSTKLEALADLVTEILAEEHRLLIFSQFTGFLTKVAEQLTAAGIDYAYLDGRTKNRPEVIDTFKRGAVPIFLISLKAGGFGLNLTEADYCILLDPWWNPASEQQAIDRIHRIGQTRNVMVYRLVAKDTIEEKVMALKADKAKLFASVMDGAAASGSRLSAAEIRSLIA